MLVLCVPSKLVRYLCKESLQGLNWATIPNSCGATSRDIRWKLGSGRKVRFVTNPWLWVSNDPFNYEENSYCWI